MLTKSNKGFEPSYVLRDKSGFLRQAKHQRSTGLFQNHLKYVLQNLVAKS